MEQKTYTVGEFARLTGVTERTLRYYDQEGVLKPEDYEANGRRVYSHGSLFELNKILALKFIGCSLAEIKKCIHSPAQQVIDTLIKHKQQLMNKRRHIDKAIDTISRAEAMIKNKSRADSDHVLSLLWHYQHEEEGVQWLTEHFSNESLDKMLMRQHSKKEQREAEYQISTLLIDMSRLYKQNKTADDPEVQRIAAEFVKLVITLSPEAADLEKYASLEKPSFFSGGFPEGFEEFLVEAAAHLAEQEER